MMLLSGVATPMLRRIDDAAITLIRFDPALLADADADAVYAAAMPLFCRHAAMLRFAMLSLI